MRIINLVLTWSHDNYYYSRKETQVVGRSRQRRICEWLLFPHRHNVTNWKSKWSNHLLKETRMMYLLHHLIRCAASRNQSINVSFIKHSVNIAQCPSTWPSGEEQKLYFAGTQTLHRPFNQFIPARRSAPCPFTLAHTSPMLGARLDVLDMNLAAVTGRFGHCSMVLLRFGISCRGRWKIHSVHFTVCHCCWKHGCLWVEIRHHTRAKPNVRYGPPVTQHVDCGSCRDSKRQRN